MVSFNAIPFDVMITDGSMLPLPAPDDGGFLWYAVTIRVDRDTYENLDDLLTGIDIVPAMAMRGGGTITRKWGPGSKSLVYPLYDGTARTRTAILVSLVPTAEFLRDVVQAEARWLVFGSV